MRKRCIITELKRLFLIYMKLRIFYNDCGELWVFRVIVENSIKKQKKAANCKLEV